MRYPFAILALTFTALTAATGAHAQQSSDRDWSGFYAGGNAGYGWGYSQAATRVASSGNYFITTDPGQIASSGKGNLPLSGLLGGAQGGYSWQLGHALFGIETDGDALSLSTSRSITTPYLSAPGTTFTINQKVSANWAATLRPRLGWAQDNWLGYVTGGLAVTQANFTTTYSDTVAPGGFSNSSISQFKAGWVIGLGAEYGLGQNWSVKAEYLHMDFGSVSGNAAVSTGSAPTTASLTHSAQLDANVLRIGFNYRFGNF